METTKMYNFEEVKDFLRKGRFEENEYQVFPCQNTVGDYTEEVYNKDGVRIFECCHYGYLDIIGLTKEDYNSIIEGVYMLRLR